MLCVPKPGARLGLNDPMCHVKSTEELTDESHERFVTEAMDREEHRMKTRLLSHTKERNKSVPQQE